MMPDLASSPALWVESPEERAYSVELDARIKDVKNHLGDRLVILGHHYQRDDVIQFADHRGDSLQLARIAATLKEAQFIVFCGVHFMAETADLLTSDSQTVILPDARAGCSMADMADVQDVEECLDLLGERFGDTVIPVTYVNSSAAVKAAVGRRGGMTVTSSNAARVLSYAFSQKQRVLFLPDQHLGRNTAVRLGIPLRDTTLYNPEEMELSHPDGAGEDRVILWRGHCSVHQRFEPRHVREVREKYPGIRVLVHPECARETVELADDCGSTDHIIRAVQSAPSGTRWAIGTEHNLVSRLAREHPDQEILSLNERVCPCFTMNRIDPPHLLRALEGVRDGQPQNVIRVPPEIASDARTAIERMMSVS